MILDAGLGLSKQELDHVLDRGNLELIPGRELAQIADRHEEIRYAIGLYSSVIGGELVAYNGKHDLESGPLSTVNYDFVVRCKTNDDEALIAFLKAFGGIASTRSTLMINKQEYTYFNCKMKFTAERPRK